MRFPQVSSLSIENLEVPEVIVIPGVDIADFLGGVADHAPVLLEPTDSRVDGTSLVGLSLQEGDQVLVLDLVEQVSSDGQCWRLVGLEL